MLHIHYLQHVPFEGLGYIEQWATARGHQITATKFYQNDKLPDIHTIDWLIIMGGPMNIYEEKTYPWLKTEKQFIQQAIQQNKTLIGICLGAQLIADALGAKIYPNSEKEIGWFPLQLTAQAQAHPLFTDLAPQLTVCHWHGETFDLPKGAVHLATSKVCPHQAFLYGEKVLGLQFHFEMTEVSLKIMVENSRHELIAAPYVQSEEEILTTKHMEVAHAYLAAILEWLS